MPDILNAPDGDGFGGCDGYYRFLRYSHILSSVLREFLEEKFLGEIEPSTLTRGQFCFLKLIALNTDLQVGEAARCIGVSPAACSKNIDKLEQLGLVSREPSPDDRRATLLSASDEGMDLVREFERKKEQQIAPVIGNLGPERALLLCDLLEEVCLDFLEKGNLHQGACLRCAGYYHADCSVARLGGECVLQMGREGRSGDIELEA